MKYKKVQQLINIKIAKAYRTTSNEALCVVTGLTPIIIKINKIATRYKTIKAEDAKKTVDIALNYKNWSHPADL